MTQTFKFTVTDAMSVEEFVTTMYAADHVNEPPRGFQGCVLIVCDNCKTRLTWWYEGVLNFLFDTVYKPCRVCGQVLPKSIFDDDDAEL